MTFSTHGVVHGDLHPFWMLQKTGVKCREFFDFLIFSSVILAIECMGEAFISGTIQDLHWSATGIIIPFLVTFSIYNLNRKTDHEEDAINQKDRFTFTYRYEGVLGIAAAAAICLAVVLSAVHSLVAVLVTLIPLTCGIVYSVRFLPASFPYRRLKEIPVVKNILVGFAWGFFVSLLPVYLNDGALSEKTFIAFLVFFTSGMIASIIPDVRDRLGDARAGVTTIPVLLGEGRTRTVLTGVNLALGTIIAVFSLAFLPPFMTIIVIGTVAYSQACIYHIGWVNRSRYFCDIISDGKFIFVSCLVISLPFLLPLLPVFS